MAYRSRSGYDYQEAYRYYADPLARLVSPQLTYQKIVQPTLNRIVRQSIQSIAALEDNRVFNPQSRTTKRPRASVQSAADLVPASGTWAMSPSAGLSFADPSRVSVCAKRHIRREVLFAKGAGGGRARRLPRRTPDSDIGC